MRTNFTHSMKLAIALVATVGFTASSSLAVSPYDLAPGLQWSFQSGGAGSESATDMDVTADGVAHLITRTSNTQAFGEGSTNSVNSDVGGIDASGNLLYGTTISSLPGIVSPSQNYAAGAHAVGNKIYYGTYSNNNAHWNDPGSVGDPKNEIGKQSNSPMVWSIDSTAVGTGGQTIGNANLPTAIGDRNSISIYSDNAGTLRVDGDQPTTTGLSIVGTQLRSTDSAMRTSTQEMIIVNDMVNGDFGTAGDYEGYGLRNSGTGNAYLPGIGRYNFATKTLDGPAKQPILTYTGPETTWSNMGVYVDAGVDQATGWYFGGGIAQSRSESKSNGWDPDGSGPAPAVTFVDSIPAVFTDDHRATSPGIGTAYDENNVLQYAVTWDTAGYDIINSVVGFGDGSNNSIWAGESFDEVYFEVRDGSGTVLASVSEDYNGATTDANRISEIEYIDGHIYARGYAQNAASGTRDSFVSKYAWDGTPGSESITKVWEYFVTDAGGTETAGDGRQVSEGISYVYSTTNTLWDNSTGYTDLASNDILLQKIVAGDFNADGVVNQDDVDIVEAGIVGSPAIDTYDFDGDGDSDQDDLDMFLFDILDASVVAIDGDFDGDQDVDNDDYTLWRNNFGAADSVLADGSGAGTGTVSAADYTLWRDNFGATGTDIGFTSTGLGAPPLLGGAGVPEPGTVALLAGGIGLGLIVLRKSRK